MTRLASILHDLRTHLESEGVRWALIGGLAVSARAEPRFTRDIDLAVAVADDRQAESLILSFQQRAYRPMMTLEQERVGRLATVRLLAPGETIEGIIVDVLFASSGIEPEIARAAEDLEILPDVRVPVARAAHLLALKLLARDDESRPQDIADIRALLREMPPDELEIAKDAIELIQARGYHRDRDLRGALSSVLQSR